MIEEYCKEHRLNPVTDKTNLSPVYFRNRIRLELLPYLRDNYNSNIDRAVLGAARVLRWENDFIAGAARDEFSRLVEEQGTGRLEFSAEKLLELHTAVLWRVLRMAVEHLLGDANNLELVHIEKLYALLEKGETGKRINLPRGIVAGVEYGRFFVARQPHPAGGIEETYRLAVPGSISIHEAGGVIEAKVFSMEDYKRERNTADDRRAFLDLAKTGRNLVVTGRKKGDRFNPLGMAGTKKLKDFFIDQKVPRNKRDLVPIVRSGRDIIWIAGYRIDEKYKVTADTRQVLGLEFRQF
jgi:tRNA(Ile)-lysidine synthase